MPAFSPITINDAAATPVAHIFDPVDMIANVALYTDRSLGVPLGFPEITLVLQKPKGRATDSKGRNYAFKAKVRVPTLEVTSPATSTGIDPQPLLAYETVFWVEGKIPERSSTQQRKDAFQFLKGLLADGNANNMIQNLESIY
jgi:hypothetical protein